MERTRATPDKGYHPTESPGGSSSRMPSEDCARLSKESRRQQKSDQDPTQLANQLLTKTHGRLRIDGDGYGCEFAKAQ
jgi:hypothetical protein